MGEVAREGGSHELGASLPQPKTLVESPSKRGRKPSHTPAAVTARVTVRPSRPTAIGMDQNLRAALATIQQSLLATEPSHTLGEAIERYRAEHLLVDGNRPSTVEWRERCLANLGRWRKRPVEGRFRDIAAQLYQEARDRGLKEATPSLQVNTLSRVLNLAKGWGWRSDDHDLRGLCRVRAGRRTGSLTGEHLEAIAGALVELDQRPRLHVACECLRLVLFTGWRVSEAADCEWAHVDARRGTVHLPHTKTGPRTAVVCRDALDVIARQPSRSNSRWVFPRRRGDGPINRRQVLGVLAAACEIAKVPHAVVHLLRHTFATTAAQLELPTVTVSAALGHSTDWQSSQYQHVREADVRNTVERVAAELRKAVH
jgi:integrase